MSDEFSLDRIRELETQIERLREESREQRDDLAFQARLNDHLIHLVQERAREVEHVNRLLQEKIAETEARKERIAVTVHDLKAPITVSLLNLELAEMEPEQQEKEYYLNAVRRELEFLLDTIASMLDLEKAANRPAASVIQDIDVNELADTVINRMRVLIKDKPALEIHNTLPAKLPALQGDRNRLMRVFNNLFSNAIKYTEEGSITIGGSLEDNGRRLHLFVSDTGAGIDAERLPRLFELFRGDSYRSDSSGVGLAYVKQAVEEMRGSVSVESERGSGTCVRMEFQVE